MKKVRCLLIIASVIFFIMIASVTTAFAEGTQHISGVFTYTVTDGEATITGCDSSVKGHLVIPETLDGYTVVGLGSTAFVFCKEIRSVTIPATVKKIGGSLFNTAIESIYVDSIETWLSFDFQNTVFLCAENLYIDGELLTDLVLPEGTKTIPNYAFNYYRKLESITVPSGLEKLGYNALDFCSRLRTFYIADLQSWLNMHTMSFSEIATIGYSLYIGGEIVKDLVIPDEITVIPSHAFDGCKSLETVTIKGRGKTFSNYPFYMCENLKGIYVDSLEQWLSFNFKDSSSNPLVFCEKLYINNNLFTSLEFSAEFTSVPDYAFSGYKSLESVTITSAIEKIGKGAFFECTGLKSVYIDSYDTWFSVDFAQVSSNPMLHTEKIYVDGTEITEVILPETIETITPYSFSGCKSIERFVIPTTVKTIKGDAFLSNKGIRYLSVPGCVGLNYGCFNGLSELTELFMGYENPDAQVLHTFGTISFINSKKLKRVTVGYGYDSIAKNVFKNFNALESIIISEDVKEIKEGAFYGCTALKSINLPESLKTIGREAFRKSGLKEITIPVGVETVDVRAFADNKSLEKITYGREGCGKSKISLGYGAFYNCSALREVVYNTGVYSSADRAFEKCGALENVYVNNLEAYLSAKYEDHFGENYYNPLDRSCENFYINGEKPIDLVIPEGTTVIPAFAFYACRTLKSITLPESLLYIGDCAFTGCKNVKEIVIPDKVRNIGDSAFAGCRSAETFKFGAGLMNVGFDAFTCCYSLEVIYMYPEQLNIGKSAFYECNNIKVILYTGTEEAWLKLLNENKRETGLENIAVFYSYRPESMLAPEGFTAKPTANSVILNWTKINGVSGYRVFVKKDSGWKALTTTNKNAYTATQLQTGTKYTFAVKAYINTGALVLWSPNYSVVDTAIPTTKPSKVTASQNSSAIKLTWAKCNGATGYRIFFKSGNVWKIAVNATAATSHTFTGLKPGAKFTFAIRPYIINGSSVIWSPYTEFATATMPSAVTAKASSPSKGSLSLSWNAVNGADGYRVYYKVGNGSYKLYKTYSSVQNLTFRNLKSGTKYTFAVRAGIRTSGGNIFGGYNTATVTVK